jgi:hypothetical protein
MAVTIKLKFSWYCFVKIATLNSDISYLESWLGVCLTCYCQSANSQLLAHICLSVDAIIQHEDFEQLDNRYCHYLKMRNYWLAQWQRAKALNCA